MTFRIFQNKPCNKDPNARLNQILFEIKGQPIEIGNALTPANKIDIGKLNWTDAKFDKSLNGIDFTKITTEELKKILDETVNHSNCPLGSFYVSDKGCISFKNFGIVPQTPNAIDIDAIFNQPLPSISADKFVETPKGDGTGSGSVLYIDPSKILQIDSGENQKETPDGDIMKLHHLIMSRGNLDVENVPEHRIDEGEIPSLASSLENISKPSTDLFSTDWMLNFSSPKISNLVQSALDIEGFNELMKNLQLEMGDIRRSLQENMTRSSATGEPVIIQPNIIRETVPMKLSLKLPGKVVGSPNEFKIEGGTLPIKFIMQKPEELLKSSVEVLNQAPKLTIDVNKFVDMVGDAPKLSEVSKISELPLEFQKKFSGSIITPNLLGASLRLEGESQPERSSVHQPFNIKIPFELLQKALQGSIDGPNMSVLGLTMDAKGSASTDNTGSFKTVNLKLPIEFPSIRSDGNVVNGETFKSSEKSSYSEPFEMELPLDILQKSLEGSNFLSDLTKLNLNLSPKSSGSLEASNSLRSVNSNSPEVNNLSEKPAVMPETTKKSSKPKLLRGNKQAFLVHQVPLISRKFSAGDESTVQPETTAAEASTTTMKPTTAYHFIPKISEAAKQIMSTPKKVVSIFLPGLFPGRRTSGRNSANPKDNIAKNVNNIPNPELRFKPVEGKTLSDSLHDEDESTSGNIAQTNSSENSETTEILSMLEHTTDDVSKQVLSSESSHEVATTKSESLLYDE